MGLMDFNRRKYRSQGCSKVEKKSLIGTGGAAVEGRNAGMPSTKKGEKIFRRAGGIPGERLNRGITSSQCKENFKGIHTCQEQLIDRGGEKSNSEPNPSGRVNPMETNCLGQGGKI